MPRLGPEYFDPREGDQSPVVQHARLVFLARIERVASEVLEALRDDVLRGNKPIDFWATRFHLTDQWVLDDARHTLEWWAQFPQTLSYSRLYFHPDGCGRMMHELDVPACPPFEPDEENEHEFDKRVEEWKRRNIAAAARLAADRGLKPSPVKNAPRGTKDPGLHFEWLVRHQCQDWTHEHIARKYRRQFNEVKRTSPTVARAINETADLIGLTLRDR